MVRNKKGQDTLADEVHRQLLGAQHLHAGVNLAE